MNKRKEAPDLARHGGPPKHQNHERILQHQAEQAKLQREKTLGIFRRRMADRIRAAEASSSPLLNDLIRFRATQLDEWQFDLPQTRLGGRSTPEQGTSRFREEQRYGQA